MSRTWLMLASASLLLISAGWALLLPVFALDAPLQPGELRVRETCSSRSSIGRLSPGRSASARQLPATEGSSQEASVARSASAAWNEEYYPYTTLVKVVGPPGLGDRTLVIDSLGAPVLCTEKLRQHLTYHPSSGQEIGSQRQVRFLPSGGCVPQTWIHVWSRDGCWAGGTTLPEDRSPKIPLRVDLRQYGRVDVRPVSMTGEAIAGCGVALQRLDTEERFDVRMQGPTPISFVEPGPYELVVSQDEHEDASARFNLAAGETAVIELKLDVLVVAGPLSGHIRTARGRCLQDAAMRIADLDRDVAHFADVEWRRAAGGVVGTWRSDPLPRGRYRVSVDVESMEDRHSWDPSSVEVTAPMNGIDFFCDDTGGTSDLAFNVVDARSGAPVREYRSYWSYRGDLEEGTLPEEAAETESGCKLAVRSWPLDHELSWTIVAPGYRPARGGVADFAEVVHGPDGLYSCATVWMERGVGFEVRVIEDETLEAVEGVWVLVDGRKVGTTDRDGRFRVDARLGSVRVEVEQGGNPGYASMAWDGIFEPADWHFQPFRFWLAERE